MYMTDKNPEPSENANSTAKPANPPLPKPVFQKFSLKSKFQKPFNTGFNPATFKTQHKG